VIPGAAPAILEPPATAAPAATPVNPISPIVAGTPGAAAFDAILMMQNVAATPECLEPEELLTAESLEDEEGEELDASLEFLTELMAVAVPVDQGRQFQGGGGQSDEPAEELPLPAGAKSGPFLEAAEAVKTANAASTETEGQNVAVTPVVPADLEPAAAPEAVENVVRGAEWLVTAQRVSTAAETHATLATPVRDPRWADELGARVSLLLRAGESSATLQLTPVDLGPVEVSVTVRDSQATVHFGASQAETRALLEASLPRLRELLASQGFQLTDASVSSGFSRSPQSGTASSTRAAAEAETSTTEARPLRSLSLLDVYA
jgi:flagellar hook-length control protein FliK